MTAAGRVSGALPVEKSAAGATFFALCLAFAGSAMAQTIVDNFSNPSNWSNTQIAFEGNEGVQFVTNSLMVLNHLEACSSGCPSGGTYVYGIHLYQAATIEPSKLGSIKSLTFSINYNCSVAECFGEGQATGLILQQSGNLYFPIQPIDTGVTTEFVSTGPVSYTPSSFGIGPGSSTGSSQQPDFSATGAPITVGFYTANSAGPYSILAEYANFKVVGNPCGVNNVPILYQGTSPWGTQPYDHLAPLTIGKRGCALTCLNMGLNFDGTAFTPLTLNSLFNGSGGYFTSGPKAGDVDWPTAVQIAAPNQLWRVMKTIDSDNDLLAAEAAVETGICNSIPEPVVVAVASPTTNKYPGHFVLVTGEFINADDTKSFLINDPAGKASVLGEGGVYYLNGTNPEFQTRGYVSRGSDPTAISAHVDATVNLLVTDPNNLQSGFYANSAEPIQNIPNSAAAIDEIDDDLTADTGSPVESVIAASPAEGQFQVALTGTSSVVYELDLSAIASDGSVQTSVLPGVINTGATATYQVVYSSTPGTPLQLILLASSGGSLPPSQTKATASGLVYSRASQTFDGAVTITNVGNIQVNGPLQMVLTSLTSGVSLANASGTFAGLQYVSIPLTGTLAPGQSATVPVQFKDPSNATISFVPLIYSGTLN